MRGGTGTGNWEPGTGDGSGSGSAIVTTVSVVVVTSTNSSVVVVVSTTGSGNVSSMTQRSHVPGVPKSAIPSSKPMDDVALIHASAETRTIVALGEDDPAGGALPSPARSTVTPFASTSSNASALFERLTVVVARLTATFSAAFSSVSG